MLAEGRAQPVSLIESAAEAAGIAKRTLNRAANSIHVTRHRAQKSQAGGFWSLPAEASPITRAKNVSTPKQFGNLAQVTGNLARMPNAHQSCQDPATHAKMPSLNESGENSAQVPQQTSSYGRPSSGIPFGADELAESEQERAEIDRLAAADAGEISGNEGDGPTAEEELQKEEERRRDARYAEGDD
jgi:hypothetical protein